MVKINGTSGVLAQATEELLRNLCLVLLLGCATSTDSGSYRVAKDGTVYDARTGWTWQQTVAAGTFVWTDAMAYCDGNKAGLPGSGWRLPTVTQLLSLMDTSHDPTIDPVAFPNTPGDRPFWSSTLRDTSPSLAYGVLFLYDASDYYDKSQNFLVRCVR